VNVQEAKVHVYIFVDEITAAVKMSTETKSLALTMQTHLC